MAKADPTATANRLFEGFLAPLVLGGAMIPGKPIGGEGALAIGEGRQVADAELASRVETARMRAARRLVAIDHLGPATGNEWALAAVLHDLVQAAHPALQRTFRRSAPTRILGFAEETLARIEPSSNILEVLARHSWFARMFEIARTDTVVKWWVGSATFLGAPPPARMTAWPELRRVDIERTARPLVDLPRTATTIDDAQFQRALRAFLAKTPLTDLATAHRDAPAFQWSQETLGVVGARAGRTLAVRALSRGPEAATEAALGRATRQLLAAREGPGSSMALDLLGEQALAAAASETSGKPLAPSEGTDDTAFARAAGALEACRTLTYSRGTFSENERHRLLAALEPRTRSPAAREAEALRAALSSGPSSSV